MNYLLKPFKKEYPFLKASDATSLLVVNHNLVIAFKNLFQHRGGYIRGSSPATVLNKPILAINLPCGSEATFEITENRKYSNQQDESISQRQN